MKNKNDYIAEVIKKMSSRTTLSFDVGLFNKSNYTPYKRGLNKQDKSKNYRSHRDKHQRRDDLMEMLSMSEGDVNVLSSLVSGSVFNDGEYGKISLSGTTLKQAAFLFTDLRGSDFSNSILKGCDFTFANLQNCNFMGALLDNCNFRHANLKNANFFGAHSIFSDFTGAEFSR